MNSSPLFRRTFRKVMTSGLYCVLFSCLFFLPHLVGAQTDYTSIPLVAYWEKGDTYQYKMTKVKKQWLDDTLTKKDSLVYDVQFRVLEANDSGFLISWRYDQLSSIIQRPDDLPVMSTSDSASVEIIYRTNEYGSFAEVINWEEVVRLCKSYIERQVYNNSWSRDSNLVKKAGKLYSSGLSSRESMETFILGDIQIFHAYFGYELSTKDTTTFEILMPTIVENITIRGSGVTYIEDVNWESSFASVVTIVIAEEAEVKKFLTDIFKKLGASKQEIKYWVAKSKMEMMELNQFQAWFNPGVPYYIESQRHVLFDSPDNSRKNIDLLAIELVHE